MTFHKAFLLVVVGLAIAFSGGVGWTYYEINVKPKPWVLTEAERAALHPETLAGFDMMAAGQQTSAIELWKKRADDHDAYALFFLGRSFAKGIGVSEDFPKAKEFFDAAASMNHPQAINWLGLFFDRGLGVSTDKKLAGQYFSKASNLGHASAQYNLGLLYERGEGVPVDRRRAFELFEQSAAQNHCLGVVALAEAYRSGIGVDTNRKKALSLYERSAKLGCDFWWARYYLKYMG